MNFKMFYGISPAAPYSTILRVLRENCPDIDPHYLVSVDKVKPGQNVAGRLDVPDAFLQSKIFKDSGGYSGTTNGMSGRDKAPEDVAAIYKEGKYRWCASPDLNFDRIDFMANFRMNKKRLEAFYDAADFEHETTIYDLVHGSAYNDHGFFDPYEMDQWLQMTKEVSKGKSLGLGIKILANDAKCPMRTAALLLYPWSKESSIVHLFGTGSIDYMVSCPSKGVTNWPKI